ncbi:uncharacterized protein LOC134253988 [Saccostrea cucullata]|uniref:uncharacterized protein LOC134253988 n=1 Tax=Saccostrea cuccullata TaxID=36930 RepID=UPI002ED3719D
MVNISCPLHGRYVIYYNERLPDINYPSDYSTDAYIELCEVEVYGCSMPRRYGPDCSLSCPVNCEDYCHIQTGICFECKPGKKGAFCEQGPAKDATDWRSRFYGVLAALCVCIAMFMMFIVAMFLRRRSSSGMDRENKGKDNKDEPCNISVTVKAEEIINSGYQGLEDQNESSAYDFIR